MILAHLNILFVCNNILKVCKICVQFLSALFKILVGLTMSLFSDKMLISHRCICGLMPNLIKKSWTVSIQPIPRRIYAMMSGSIFFWWLSHPHGVAWISNCFLDFFKDFEPTDRIRENEICIFGHSLLERSSKLNLW